MFVLMEEFEIQRCELANGSMCCRDEP
jgi:hypothetical protein